MKTLWRFFAVLLSMALLGGCGGGGGSSAKPVDPVQATTTLTTTLGFGDSQPAAAGVRSAAVQAATVTLTLPDGTTYAMSDNGSGGFSCTVTNFPTGSPFVIEAQVGDLVLKNFFDKLPGAGAAIDLGATDPKSTLFVDLLATFVGVLEANQNFSAAQLLEAMQEATLTIDTIALKTQVNDDNDTVFHRVRQSYQSVLTRENFEAGAAPAELITARNETMTTVKDEFQTGGVAPPVAGNDVESAKLLVLDYYKAFLAGDWTAVAAKLGSTGFLWSGMNAAQWLAAEQTDGWEVTAPNLVGIRTSVLAGPEADSWWVYFGAELTYSEGGLERKAVWDNRKGMGASPILVKKDSAGLFAIYGDQKKADLGASLTYAFEENQRSCLTGNCPQNSWMALEVRVEETSHYPVAGAQLSGSALAQSFPLEQRAGGDASDLDFWKQYRINGDRTAAFTGILEGTALTVDITFTDSSEERRTVVVPPAVTPKYPKITGLTPHADGSLTITWSDISTAMPGGAELAVIEVEIIDDRSGWFYLLELEDLVPGTTSVTIPHGVLEPETIYLARIAYFDLSGREFIGQRYFQASAPFTDDISETFTAGEQFDTILQDGLGATQAATLTYGTPLTEADIPGSYSLERGITFSTTPQWVFNADGTGTVTISEGDTNAITWTVANGTLKTTELDDIGVYDPEDDDPEDRWFKVFTPVTDSSGNNFLVTATIPQGQVDGGYYNILAKFTPNTTLVGSWGFRANPTGPIFGVDTSVADGEVISSTFYENGTYVVYSGGIEYGTYTYNAATGVLTAISIVDESLDNGGLTNLVGVPSTMLLQVDADTLVFKDDMIDGQTVDTYLYRVKDAAKPIVGGWGFRKNANGPIFGVDMSVANGEVLSLTFYPNGTYVVYSGGIEYGTYSYDTATGVLTATSVVDESLDNGGLTNQAGVASVMQVQVDADILIFKDDMIDGQTVDTYLYRVK